MASAPRREYWGDRAPPTPREHIPAQSFFDPHNSEGPTIRHTTVNAARSHTLTVRKSLAESRFKDFAMTNMMMLVGVSKHAAERSAKSLPDHARDETHARIAHKDVHDPLTIMRRAVQNDQLARRAKQSELMKHHRPIDVVHMIAATRAIERAGDPVANQAGLYDTIMRMNVDQLAAVLTLGQASVGIQHERSWRAIEERYLEQRAIELVNYNAVPTYNDPFEPWNPDDPASTKLARDVGAEAVAQFRALDDDQAFADAKTFLRDAVHMLAVIGEYANDGEVISVISPPPAA